MHRGNLWKQADKKKMNYKEKHEVGLHYYSAGDKSPKRAPFQNLRVAKAL
jgi:hypothetical protein